MADNPNAEHAFEERIAAAFAHADAAATYEAALPFVTEAIMLQLHQSLIAIGERDAEDQIALLKRTRLDRLIMQIWEDGRLTSAATDRYLVSAKAALRAGEFDSYTLKMGILAFDGVMQRLMLASEKSEPAYPITANPARDLLIGFAQSLHR
jgi:hypothetical protein